MKQLVNIDGELYERCGIFIGDGRAYDIASTPEDTYRRSGTLLLRQIIAVESEEAYLYEVARANEPQDAMTDRQKQVANMTNNVPRY